MKLLNGGILTSLVLLLLGSAQAADVFYEWDLEAILDNTLSPDCMNVKDARRTMFLVANDTVVGGGVFPGPMIEVTEGDTIHVSAVVGPMQGHTHMMVTKQNGTKVS
jgi:hypothetical protein